VCHGQVFADQPLKFIATTATFVNVNWSSEPAAGLVCRQMRLSPHLHARRNRAVAT
jgi:hypothetical protein